MKKLKQKINKLTKNQKYGCLILILMFFLLLVISIPSLAKFKNRVTLYNEPVWDGMVATDYNGGDGTQENPYIISNGSELAYFSKQVNEKKYENTYFELSNDIVLNDGVFDYNESEGLIYILNNTKYYIKPYTNNYYNNTNYNGEPVGSINTLSSLKNFKGIFNGNSYVIYGNYVTDQNEEKLGLFTDLEGTVTDLYVENSVVYGGSISGGIASNSRNNTLNNIIYNGFVISGNKVLNNIVDVSPTIVSAPTVELTTNLNINIPQIEGNIVGTKLTGEYTVSDETANAVIKINGTIIKDGKFEIDLGTNLQNQIQITTLSDFESVTVNFTNLKYNIEYRNSVVSGIVANPINTSFVNVVNKADVYGSYISSGIVGYVNNSLQINRVYNLGNINSNFIASGIVGVIENNSSAVSILNSYNAGYINSNMSAAILGKVNSNVGLIKIENTFTVSNNYSINSIIGSTVNISNCYNINGLSLYNGTSTGSFVQKDLASLYNETFLVSTLGFNKFIDDTDVLSNKNNVWIIDNKTLPYLYIDNSSDPVASINISKYSWNNLSSNLDVINLQKNIVFNIEDLSQTRPVQNKYYYISNSMTPLTQEQLNNVVWTEYKELVQIDQSGYYVLYAKIVEYDGTTTYINSDILALNKSGFQVDISLLDNNWKNSMTPTKDVYINKEEKVYVYALNDLIGIQSVQYYISNDIITEDKFDSIGWVDYGEFISINGVGKYIIYVKVVDNNQNVKYVNTDYIVYNGYQEELFLGKSKVQYNSNNITDNSTLTINFSNDIELKYLEGYKHNFVSNILLPLNTKITLIDYGENKAYSYKIDTNDDLFGYTDNNFASYPFDLFEEIGVEEVKKYDESTLYNKTISNQKYTIILDFNETTITQNYYNVNFSLTIDDSFNNKVIQTLNSTVKNINIYKDDTDINTNLSLTSDYTNGYIAYNTDSIFSLNLNNTISYNTFDNVSVINTEYEEKNIGLEIKIVDANGTIISKENLQDMVIKLNDQEYAFDSNSILKVNLGNALNQSVKTLTVITKEGSKSILQGTYYLKIKNYLSNDGYNYSNFGTHEINVPIVVGQNQIQYGTSLNVDILSDSIVINKDSNSNTVLFNINILRELENPMVKVSLYEKEKLSAYDQVYNLINLKEYVSNQNLTSSGFTYDITSVSTQYEFVLNLNEFNNNGYKYVFELYDGATKIDEIEKYFIIK